ncbi:unnamed protein product [Ostreobium quekettii]|uniref:Uncharacterized protein n=1 Tax=Ostreobium quekettii TaxID=121088 RepID=A0A8S1IQN3_9CHLO|nr:unnamed protein product [Ostreobium quekettii]|eukprot:evm.model.scf_178.9 EVM.evm.TU.scf_178.9   scf_178:89728-100396(+)
MKEDAQAGQQIADPKDPDAAAAPEDGEENSPAGESPRNENESDSDAGSEVSAEDGADACVEEGGKAGGSKRKKKKRKAKRPGAAKMSKVIQNLPNEMWIDLEGCELRDADVVQLAGALKSNSSVTMINLSSNGITDGGAQALADVITAGSLPDLISVDLRGNDLTPEGIRMLEGVCSSQRNLAVELGPMPAKEAEVVAPVPEKEHDKQEPSVNHQPKLPDAWGEDDGGVKVEKTDEGWQVPSKERTAGWHFTNSGGLQLSGSLGRQIIVFTNGELRQQMVSGTGNNQQLTAGWQKVEQEESSTEGSWNQTSWRRYRRYFRRDPHDWNYIRDDVDAMVDHTAEAELAAELWQKIADSVKVPGQTPQALSSVLTEAGRPLEAEVETFLAPIGQGAVDSSRPHLACASGHLDTLSAIFDVEPPPATFQNGGSPQPAVGLHRLAAAEIVALLLSTHSDIISEKIAASGLTSRIVGLAVRSPHCNALQCTAARVVQTIIENRSESLFKTVFDGEMLAGKGGEVRVMEKPLQKYITEIGVEGSGMPIGKRKCHVGSIAALAKTLVQNGTGSEAQSTGTSGALSTWSVLRDVLEADDDWSKFVSTGGALDALVKEQNGELCPPRARYFNPSEEAAEPSGSAVYEEWSSL